MGFKLSSLFFVEDEATKKDNGQKSGKNEAALKEDVKTAQNIKNEPIQVNPEIIIPASVDNEIAAAAKEALIKAIENANLEGYDYIEFKNSLKALENVIQDEPTRYKSAYAAVSPMGVTGEKLTASANHYIEVLKNEEKKFLFALGTKSDTDVAGSEKRLVQIDEEIKKKGELIAQLTQEIEKMKNDKIVIEKSINDSRQKIENSKNGFYSAYKEVVDNISSDITKISNFIK